MFGRDLGLIAFFMALLCMVQPACGDECTDKCPSCTAFQCQFVSGVPGGCWFDGKNCFMCSGGDRDASLCQDYPEESCQFDPCSIAGGCKWVMDTCISAGSGSKQLGCKSTGCDLSYRCMADGECVHFTVPVQEYCSLAYGEHGLSYDLSDPQACEKVEEVCLEIERKCDALSKDSLGSSRAEDCAALKSMCLQCSGDCELRRSFASIEGIVYGIAAGIAVLIMMISGITLASSEDSVARSNAKRSIVYVVIGLLVIVVAVKFVEYLWMSFV